MLRMCGIWSNKIWGLLEEGRLLPKMDRGVVPKNFQGRPGEC